MLVSLIVNITLVVIGYYIGIMKAKEDWQRHINESPEIEEAFRSYIKERDTPEEVPETLVPEEVPEVLEPEEVYEPPEGRMFKLFNVDISTPDN